MCTLRAYGKTFDVDRFLKRWPLKVSKVFHRGEVRHKRKTRLNSFNQGISNASWTNLPAQIRDATKFIQKHRTQLAATTGTVMQQAHFPEAFVRLAASFGMAIHLSIYVCAAKAPHE